MDKRLDDKVIAIGVFVQLAHIIVAADQAVCRVRAECDAVEHHLRAAIGGNQAHAPALFRGQAGGKHLIGQRVELGAHAALIRQGKAPRRERRVIPVARVLRGIRNLQLHAHRHLGFQVAVPVIHRHVRAGAEAVLRRGIRHQIKARVIGFVATVLHREEGDTIRHNKRGVVVHGLIAVIGPADIPEIDVIITSGGAHIKLSRLYGQHMELIVSAVAGLRAAGGVIPFLFQDCRVAAQRRIVGGVRRPRNQITLGRVVAQNGQAVRAQIGHSRQGQLEGHRVVRDEEHRREPVGNRTRS